MKKGCFITAITLFTLLVMAGLYLFKTNKDFFKNFGKEKMVENITEEMDKKFNKVIASPYRDSIYTVFKKELKKFNINDFENSLDNISLITVQLKKLIKDNVVDSTDLNEFKNFVRNNEESSKNRN